jgi:hypothetical protein
MLSPLLSPLHGRGEDLAKHPFGPKEARLDRAQGDAQGVGDLLVGKVFEIAQDEDDAILAG